MLQAAQNWFLETAGLRSEPTKIIRIGVIFPIQYKYLHRNQGDSYILPVPERDH